MKTKDDFRERLIATLELAAAMVLIMLALGWWRDADADTNLVWSPAGTNRDIGVWQCAADATAVLTGTSYQTATIVPFGPLAPTANVYRCAADRPVGSGAGCPAPGSYTQEGMAPKSQARLCAPPPPPPPPDPPPLGPPAKPWNVVIHSALEYCHISAGLEGVPPLRIEAEKFGTTVAITGADPSRVTCAELGITTPGAVVMVRVRVANAGGVSPWTGFWPLVRWAPENPEPALRAFERVEYQIVKHPSENYSLQPTDARPMLCLLDGIASGQRTVYARNGNSRGAILGQVQVGPTSQPVGAANPVTRTRCSCTEYATLSGALYARVQTQGLDGWSAGCRTYGMP